MSSRFPSRVWEQTQTQVSRHGIELSPITSVSTSDYRSLRKVYCGKMADWIRMSFEVVSGEWGRRTDVSCVY